MLDIEAARVVFALLVAALTQPSGGGDVEKRVAPDAAVMAVNAAEYRSPVYNHCIREFYDPEMYNWFSFENTCGEALSVTFVAINRGFGGAVSYLGAGRKTSTGDSREQVRSKGGYELYVCPAGFLPVDGNDHYVTRPNTRFRCRQQ
jgi:hypothetical protein